VEIDREAFKIELGGTRGSQKHFPTARITVSPALELAPLSNSFTKFELATSSALRSLPF